ncbi:hypothetical protein EZS27_012965 [termite gut metagenome]|uniref:ATPase AAA-type core domain-containing protein n=1 Tax=termite gut metagenome TaxID=433724 RepID=A0A5J4S1D1_9ZZZZ
MGSCEGKADRTNMNDNELKNDIFMANFSIIALRVLDEENKNITKVLKKGWYFFNQLYKVDEKNDNKLVLNDAYPLKDYDFLGKNISISAIVGKNGSGKSSLLELFFRMIYNLSVKMNLLTSLDTRDKPTYCKLNAEVYFFSNNIFYGLKNDNESVYLFRQKITNNFELDTSNISWGNEVTKNNQSYLESFFYSIVVNYSIQAYISNDYNDNKTKYSWIDYLFHKNDGYKLPLVLNPFRSHGTINLNTEYDLTIQRLSALLIDNNNFIDGYSFKNISLKNNFSKINEMFTKLPTNDDNSISTNPYNLPTIKDKFIEYYGIFVAHNTDNNPLNSSFDSTPPSLTIKLIEIAYQYLILKSVSISTKYQNFKNNELNIKNRFDKSVDDILNKNASTYNDKIKNLVEKIQSDTSHITLKIKQVLNFIKYIQNNGVGQIKYDYLLNDKTFLRDTRLSNLDQIIAI